MRLLHCADHLRCAGVSDGLNLPRHCYPVHHAGHMAHLGANLCNLPVPGPLPQLRPVHAFRQGVNARSHAAPCEHAATSSRSKLGGCPERLP